MGRLPSPEALEKERQAVEKYLAGKTYEQIARDLGYADRSGARKIVERAMLRQNKGNVEKLRELENRRLDAIQSAHWHAATNEFKPDIDSAKIVLKTMERRAKLNGLDRAVKVEHTGPGGDPLRVEIIADVLPDVVKQATGDSDSA